MRLSCLYSMPSRGGVIINHQRAYLPSENAEYSRFVGYQVMYF